MKKRILTISLIVASLVLLISVGFAGWVISNVHSGEASGNFTAYNVVQNGSITVANDDTTVIFGHPSTMGGTPWLTFTGTAEEISASVEDLHASFTITVENLSSGQSLTLNLAHAFNTTPSPLLVGAPTFKNGSSVISDPTHFTLSANGTYTINVEYSWGTLFGGDNPYVYFNGKTNNVI